MITIAIALICLLTILAVSSPLKAQSFYGSILGTVRDTSGAVVPGRERESDQHRNERKTKCSIGCRRSSTASVNLVPATYKVEVTKARFKQFLSDQVTVEVGAVVRVDCGIGCGCRE